ncbi:hypothetical protein [Streptomyces sp. NPDC127190]|uniref:hypothetical protein n=1 Tax=unclassified Streptomyces TaxID=2593676 RepID=UPI0036291F05
MAALIRRTDPDATLVYRSPYEPAVFFELAERNYAITVTTAAGEDAVTAARVAVTARERDLGPGVRWALKTGTPPFPMPLSSQSTRIR